MPGDKASIRFRIVDASYNQFKHVSLNRFCAVGFDGNALPNFVLEEVMLEENVCNTRLCMLIFVVVNTCHMVVATPCFSFHPKTRTCKHKRASGTMNSRRVFAK